jgi:uncharacterized membrane protein YdjX (TVP38/TMEM64 family)
MLKGLPLLVLGIATGLFVAGGYLRQQLELDFAVESLETMRVWVQGFGPLGPSIFIGVVAFRTFLLLPSHLCLIAGGLAFGALAGTLWGTIGLGASGLLQYAGARVFGDAWKRRAQEHGHDWTHRVRRAGPTLVSLTTAHPAGPLTAVNVGAGLAGIASVPFLLAVLVGAPFRAGAFATLGDSILSWGILTSLSIAVGLGTLAALPLLSPAFRRWLFADPEDPGRPPLERSVRRAPGPKRGAPPSPLDAYPSSTDDATRSSSARVSHHDS